MLAHQGQKWILELPCALLHVLVRKIHHGGTILIVESLILMGLHRFELLGQNVILTGVLAG